MQSRNLGRIFAAALLAAILVAATASAAREDDAGQSGPRPDSEFEFVRLLYTDQGARDFLRCACSVDWPEAEQFFGLGVSRLTRVAVDGESTLLGLDDGNWRLTQYETERLREYLLRGGFLMVDDFHGSYEWEWFAESMNRVFPDRPMVDIDDASEILHVVYDVDERIQVPGIVALNSGRTYEDDGYVPTWRGIYDDAGRLMVVINHNMDLGDAWEHADTPGYPQEMTTLALHFAVNYVIYAMTH
jgi:hypothetical protein